MGIFDFLNNKKKEKARQEQLRLQKKSVVQKNNDDWQSVVSKKINKGVKNRSCLISSLILPVISVMKMVNL